MKVQEIYGVTEYAGTLTRVQGLSSTQRTCMAKRCDRSTPQYNPGDTGYKNEERIKDFSSVRTGSGATDFLSYSIDFRGVLQDWNT